jgi:AraC family transcriptional regulator
MPVEPDLLHVLRDIRRRLNGHLSLAGIAARAGWSPFYLHRAFRRLVGETPKQYTLRLRLERAAARLAAGDEPVLDVALDEGFTSHEVFTRAFNRHFDRSPVQYRAAALKDAPASARARHVAITDATGPCIGLFHLPIRHHSRRPTMPTLSIARQQFPGQPILFVRLRVARHEIPAGIAEGLGKAYPLAQKAGLALAGRPFTRYLSTGPGLFTIEVGVPLAAPAPGEGAVEAGLLASGPVAVAVHAGPYDQLGETYAALERWIEAHGHHPAGPPWESYITDPADHPDPGDWRTEVYWPLAD